MSASSSPTRWPMAARPMARLTAVVDLPTPPLPDATAMIAFTPGTRAAWAGRGAPPSVGGGPAAGRPPGARSAVSTAEQESTPGRARTVCSHSLRTGSKACASAGCTSIAKPTFPLLTTTPEIMPRLTMSSSRWG